MKSNEINSSARMRIQNTSVIPYLANSYITLDKKMTK